MTHALIAFDAGAPVRAFTADIELIGDRLRCAWSLAAEPGAILWPAPGRGMGRAMNLWEHTCLECFIGPVSQPDYIEINLTTSGQWNSFHFTDVRQEMAESPLLVCESMSPTPPRPDGYDCAAQFNLSAWAEVAEFRIGIAAVIETRAGERHFFALAHPPTRPDFHHRANHLIQLARNPP
jgi:hypothetical protein